ncbi:MAG: hypothetical protein KF869_09015 [Phycisphaeraceae bacterium]|nr:hypothetical protein [Phycisphaeraceae bacterium]
MKAGAKADDRRPFRRGEPFRRNRTLLRTHEVTEMDQSSTSHETGTQRPTPTGSAGGDAGVLSLIADLETRLAGLKQMHEHGALRQAELDEREASLARREAQVLQSVEALTTRQNEIEQLAAAAASRQEQVQQSLAALDQRREELERAAREAENARTESHRRAEQAAQAERAAGERLREAERTEAGIAEARSEIERLREEISREREESRRELDALEAALAQREAQAAEAAESLERHRAELAGTQENLALAQQRLADESGRFRSEAARMEQEARERADALRELEDRLNERMAELKDEADRIEREKVMVTEQARTLAGGAGGADEHASAIHSGRAEQVQVQLGEANARNAGLQTELAQVKEDLANALEQLAQAQSALGQAQRVSPEEIDRRDREAQGLRDEIEQLRSASDLLRSRIEQSEAAAASTHTADEQEIAKREQAIIKLKDKLDAANREVARLREQGAGGAVAGGQPGPSSPRRERLRRYKSLLQAQARKIIQAQAALQKRHGECEQVLSQRARIQAAWADIQSREQRAAASKSRGSAAVVVLCATLTVAVLAALSWTVAEKLWPGTYVARASLRADAHGRAAAPHELQSWQAYHEDLVRNPQLLEIAAERMARRGIAKLGSVGDLRTKLDKDLYVQSAGAGELTIELREAGGERAKLVLDTYVTAIKSAADAARDGRAEDLGTLIAEPAAVLGAPINDQRLRNAGMLLGGGCTAALLAGLLVWSRMAGAKRKFDESQAVQAALEEVEWSALEATMKKGAEGGRKSRGSRG